MFSWRNKKNIILPPTPSPRLTHTHNLFIWSYGPFLEIYVRFKKKKMDPAIVHWPTIITYLIAIQRIKPVVNKIFFILNWVAGSVVYNCFKQYIWPCYGRASVGQLHHIYKKQIILMLQAKLSKDYFNPKTDQTTF